MPDGDYLAWKLGGKWRKVANLMKSRASMLEVQDAVASAVASTIRSSGGVPQFTAVVDKVCMVASGGGAVDEQFTAIGRPVEGGVVGRLLEDVAQGLALTLQANMNLVSPKTASELLARRFLARIAGAGLDLVLPKLVGEEIYTMVELRSLLRQTVDSQPMDKLTDRLIQHPTGEGLRAPNKRTAVKPMHELIDTDLGDL